MWPAPWETLVSHKPQATFWRGGVAEWWQCRSLPRLHASGPLGELHATNAPHTPLFNLPHFSRALAREQCARATAEAAPSRPKAASPAPSLKPSARRGQVGFLRVALGFSCAKCDSAPSQRGPAPA